MDKQFLFSVIRHISTKAAGILIAHGWMTNNDTEQWLSITAFLATLGWSWWEKKQAKAKQ